jgi:hypothetical protein
MTAVLLVHCAHTKSARTTVFPWENLLVLKWEAMFEIDDFAILSLARL